MPRQARKKRKTGIYHQTIFQDDEDCAKLIKELLKIKEKVNLISMGTA